MAEPASAKLATPWLTTQLQSLLRRRGHAWLLQGPSGLGQYELALMLVRAWLCEAQSDAPERFHMACGRCVSCHAIDVRAHPDLAVLMPETWLLEYGWPLGEKAQRDLDGKKRKPSREIRVDAMRQVVEFAQRTSGRGRGKAVLIYPAERMNPITANALLKTLEEPVGNVRFVLASHAADALLPTIRSRCQTHVMAWPRSEEALAWLAHSGVLADDAAALLRAAGDRPQAALELATEKGGVHRWSALPRALAAGDAGVLDALPTTEAVARLQKLCHDLVARGVGTSPRFFSDDDLPRQQPPLPALLHWHQELLRSARQAEHPLNAGLTTEFLVGSARRVLNSRR